MDIEGYWLTPLLLLPGTAVRVFSMVQCYGQLHEELHPILVLVEEMAEKRFR